MVRVDGRGHVRVEGKKSVWMEIRVQLGRRILGKRDAETP